MEEKYEVTFSPEGSNQGARYVVYISRAQDDTHWVATIVAVNSDTPRPNDVISHWSKAGLEDIDSFKANIDNELLALNPQKEPTYSDNRFN